LIGKRANLHVQMEIVPKVFSMKGITRIRDKIRKVILSFVWRTNMKLKYGMIGTPAEV